MYFDSFADFLAMGNHGLYVWMAYGFFALIMVWILADLRLGRKTSLERAQRVWDREGATRTKQVTDNDSREGSP